MKLIIWVFLSLFTVSAYAQVDTREQFFGLGHNKADHKEYNKAIDYYNRALTVDSLYLEVYFYRGFARVKTHDTSGALSDFSKLIKLDSGRTSLPFIFRAYLKASLSDNKGALEDCIQALKIDTILTWLYLDMGRCEYNLGDYKRAETYYTYAINCDSTWAEAFSLRGLVRQKLNETKGAGADNNKAKKIIKEHPAISYLIIARKNLQLWEYDSAIANYNKAMELDPLNALAFAGRGQARANLITTEKPDQEIMKDFDRAIELDPMQEEFYYHRAVLRLNLNNKDDAGLIKADCDKAIEINPKYGKAYMIRAISNLNGGPTMDLSSICGDLKRAFDLGVKLPAKEMEGFAQLCP